MPQDELFDRLMPAPGAPPGHFQSDELGHPPRLRLISYDAHELVELELERVSQLAEHVRPGRVTWIERPRCD